MNFNILSFVKEQLSGYVIGKMSDFLGENPYKTASALENVLPVVLGGLVNKSSETQGAGQMMDQIKDAGHDGKVFDNLNDIVKDPDAMLDWLSSGSNLSNHIFGDKINSVIDGISGENDIRKTSAASLLSFLSPLVLGAVGKHVTGNSLGISGIIDLMNANRSVAEQSLTPDMKYALGLGSANAQPANTSTQPAANTQAASNKKPSSSNNLLKWLLPLLLVGIMGGGLAYYYLVKKKRDDSNISFFDKWTKKDTAPTVSTSEGDSLKQKLLERRKNSELSDKATQLSKSETTTTTSSGSMSLVDSLKQKLEQRKLRESGKSTESSSLLATTETKVEPPKVEPPKVEPPKVETKATPPKIEPPKVETKATPPKVETPKVEAKPKKQKETSNTGFTSRTPSKSKNRSYSSTTKRSYRNNLGTDIIEDLDGPSSYPSPSYSSRTYTTTTSSNNGSRGDLSSAIRSRSINAEFALDGITFVNGGYEFTGSSKSELNRLASILKSNPSAKVFIQGFAMSGNAEDHELSQMRAEWVRYALIERGVRASNVEARGHGQSNQTSLGSIPRNKVSMKLIGI